MSKFIFFGPSYLTEGEKSCIMKAYICDRFAKAPVPAGSNQKGSRFQMTKKIITIVICTVLLILPTVVAIASYTHAQNNPVTRASVSQMEVSSPDGKTYSYRKSDGAMSPVFDCFFGMNEDAKKVSSLLSDASAYQVFTATYRSYNKTSTYTYFLTQDPTDAFYRDGNGTYYRIDREAAGRFLATEYAVCLFPSAAQPTMTAGSSAVTVLPSDQEWKFLGYAGQYMDSAVTTTDEVLTCDVSGGLQLSFSVAPDQVFVTMKDKSGQVVHEDVLENVDPALFSENTVYDVTVTAKWYQTDERANYGEATYRFTANVLSPAVFYLNTTETEYGNFVVVSAKNIIDPSQIDFRSEPSIFFEPVFFEYGGYYHALVPFSMECEAENDGAGSYSFVLSYGEVEQVLRLNVSQRDVKKAYQNIPLATINAYRNEVSLNAFAETMREPFGNQLTDLYWMTDNMLTVPVSGRSIKVGYGLQIILQNAANTSYRHEGVNFGVKANDTVHACLPGKVVFAGETRLSGRTVVVDHGGGLKSLYAHLDSMAVSVGDVVEKGRLLGIVGSTGFCDGRTLHFGLYVFDVPVRYYDYETSGIRLSSVVEEDLGLRR